MHKFTYILQYQLIHLQTPRLNFNGNLIKVDLFMFILRIMVVLVLLNRVLDR
jgi:hypothetical protein